MSSNVSSSGTGPSYQTNFSSSPTDPELDPQAAEKALQALNDGTFQSCADIMKQFEDSYNGGPVGSKGGGGDNWDWATSQKPPVKPWWQTYEPIAAYRDNCEISLFHQWDSNIINAPTVKLWACFFGVQTGYSDPNKQGPDPMSKHDGLYYHDPGYNVQPQDTQDTISQMIAGLKGKIEIIESNILGVAGNPAEVQKLNALRCQMTVGLNAANRLNDWRDAVMAWNSRAQVSNYDMLHPNSYGDGYKGPLSFNGTFPLNKDNAQEREDDLWTKIGAGPNNNDPYPRPPFDPFELALTCLQTCRELSNPL